MFIYVGPYGITKPRKQFSLDEVSKTFNNHDFVDAGISISHEELVIAVEDFVENKALLGSYDTWITASLPLHGFMIS